MSSAKPVKCVSAVSKCLHAHVCMYVYAMPYELPRCSNVINAKKNIFISNQTSNNGDAGGDASGADLHVVAEL